MSLEDQIDQLNEQVRELKFALETKVDVLEKLLFLSASPASITALNDHSVTERYIQLKSGTTRFRLDGWLADGGLTVGGVRDYGRPVTEKKAVPAGVVEVVAALAGAGMKIRCVE